MEDQKKTETKFQFLYVFFFQLIILTSFYSQSQYEDIYNTTNPRTTYAGTDIQPELDKIEEAKVGFPQPKPKNK